MQQAHNTVSYERDHCHEPHCMGLLCTLTIRLQLSALPLATVAARQTTRSPLCNMISHPSCSANMCAAAHSLPS